MSALLDAIVRSSLRAFREPIHKLVDEGYDVVEGAARAALDGEPDADGELNPFEREASPQERALALNFVGAFRDRLHKEVDRLLDAGEPA
jgi:hypothetical protein